MKAKVCAKMYDLAVMNGLSQLLKCVFLRHADYNLKQKWMYWERIQLFIIIIPKGYSNVKFA